MAKASKRKIEQYQHVTVEAVPAPTVRPIENPGEPNRVSGRVEGETKNGQAKRAVISFGQEHAPLE
jgi:hypothetical protein